MTERAEVPPHPLVTIEIDDDDRLTINGHDVPHNDSSDPHQFATEIVRTDFAVPLGRPVRALATLEHELIQMVVHPDGRVTDVEPHRPATPAGVPPATRAQARVAAGDVDSVAAEVAAAHRAGRRRYPVAVAGAGAIAAVAALVVVWNQRDPATDSPPASAARTQDAAAEVTPAQPVIESERIRPRAVSDVHAEARPRILRLSVTTQRKTTARVEVSPVATPAAPRQFSLSIQSATTRLITVASLAPGRYRWQVLVPGQPPYSGVIRIPALPPPDEDATIQDEAPAEAPEDGGTGSDSTAPSGGDGGTNEVQQPTGVSDGPNQPVDPDGD